MYLLLNIYFATWELIKGTHANPGINITAVLQYVMFILVIVIIQPPVHAYFGYEYKYCCYVKYPASSKLWFTHREKTYLESCFQCYM